MVVGRPFMHSLIDSIGQIHQGLDVHYAKSSETFCTEKHSEQPMMILLFKVLSTSNGRGCLFRVRQPDV